MVLDLSQFSPSDYAAWWGAVVASLALIWNIVTALRSGARVRVRVSPNIKVFPSQPPTYDKSYVSITAVNVGNGATTLTHCAGFHAKNFWGIFREKERQHFMVNISAALGKDIPCILEPGNEWSNLADQTYLEKRFVGGYLYLGIIHNQRKRPIYKLVKLRV